VPGRHASLLCMEPADPYIWICVKGEVVKIIAVLRIQFERPVVGLAPSRNSTVENTSFGVTHVFEVVKEVFAFAEVKVACLAGYVGELRV